MADAGAAQQPSDPSPTGCEQDEQARPDHHADDAAGNLRQMLAELAARQVELIEQLMWVSPVESLKPDAISGCQGIVFMELWKAGLGITYGKGTGFAIRRLAGTGQWSPPLFFTAVQGGIGLSVGFQTFKALVALQSGGGLDQLCLGKFHKISADVLSMSFDAGGVVGGADRKGEEQVPPGEAAARNRVYVLSGGAMLPIVALNGMELALDDKLNHQLYGDTKPEDVLAGAAPHCAELDPLYQRLDALAQGRAPR